jgi:hypothetical protein
VKTSRSRDKQVHPSKTTEENLDGAAGAAPEAPLAPEERTRLLIKLEAELEAAEHSIEAEGTISAEEFLQQRADYWAAPGYLPPPSPVLPRAQAGGSAA